MSRTSGAMPGFAPIHRVFFLPYLFKDEAHMWRVTDGPIGEEITEQTLKDAGVKIVAYWSTGVRHFFHKNKEIRTPEDMEGVKLRVMEDRIFMESFKEIGALPTPIPYTELYSALATGVVDAAENDSAGYRFNKFYEVAPYFSLSGHMIIGSSVIINPKFYNQMPDDIKEVFERVMKEATDYQRHLYATNFEDNIEFLKEQGVTVTEDVDRDAFVKAMQPAWKRLGDIVDLDLVQRIVDLR
jgi:tripartite ATP-independent transporter DctP family solute receptor